MAARAVKVDERRLSDLAGVGPVFLENLHAMGVKTVAQLAKCDARRLYKRLCAMDGQKVDICAQDLFMAAIAQARDPQLDPERRCWWWWSRERKKLPTQGPHL